MSTEALKEVPEKLFIHLMYDMWTGKYGNNYLGTYFVFIHKFQNIKVFLGLELNNISYGADFNTTLLDVSLLKNFKFNFSRWCASNASDTTSCVVNVDHAFSKDTKNIDSKMHELNSCLKYGFGILENTTTKFT